MDEAVELLVSERNRLVGRLEQEREQLELLAVMHSELQDRIAHDEKMLRNIEGVLGRSPELTLDDLNVRLRGQRLEEIAIEVLSARGDPANPIHYREWFELLRQRGHLVAGKAPLDTFLAQINRSPSIERIGRRSGLYRLASGLEAA